MGIVAAGLLAIGVASIQFPAILAVDHTSQNVPGCGATYTIQRGDTLSEISQRIYGRSRYYRDIFEANRDRLTDPAILNVGDTIILPCLEGVDATAVAAAPAAPEPALAVAVEQQIAAPTGSVPEAVPIRLAAATGRAPYADARLDSGGLIPALVSKALAGASAGRETSLQFVADWPADPATLLGDGGFDLSLPWFRPDCAAAGAGSPLCAGVAFSNPLYEIPFMVYLRANSARIHAAGSAALAGARVCRAAGALAPGFETTGAVPADARIDTAPDLATCFERLYSGAADAVIALAPGTDKLVRDLGLDAEIKPAEALRRTLTLHAVALESNAGATAQLEALNRGIDALKASGDWFSIVTVQNASAARR